MAHQPPVTPLDAEHVSRLRAAASAYHDALWADAQTIGRPDVRREVEWLANELRRQVCEQRHDAVAVLAAAGVLRQWTARGSDLEDEHHELFWSAAEGWMRALLTHGALPDRLGLGLPKVARYLEQAGMAALMATASAPPADADKPAVTCPAHATLVNVNLAGRFPQAALCPGKPEAGEPPHALLVSRDAEDGHLVVEREDVPGAEGMESVEAD